MKRIFYLITLLLSINLIGCVDDTAPEDPLIPAPEEPEEGVINPSDYSALEIIDLLTVNLANKKNYLKSTIGISKTLSGLNVVQDIENNTYVYPEYVYAHYSSDSSVVTFNHKALLYKDIVNYSHAGKWSTKWYLDTKKDDYIKQYGILADSENFTGYIINEETVLETNYNFQNNYFIFEYDLDLNLSCEDMKIQMKEFGGLVSLPEFEKIKVTIYLDFEFNILKIETYEVYNTVKKVIGNIETKLEQNLVTTFINFEDGLDLPSIDKYL